jgi:hypothetical protein
MMSEINCLVVRGIKKTVNFLKILSFRLRFLREVELQRQSLSKYVLSLEAVYLGRKFRHASTEGLVKQNVPVLLTNASEGRNCKAIC